MKTSPAAVDAEHDALEAITTLLEKPEHRRGLTQRQIADLTGLSIGRVQLVCRKSEIILKRRSHHHDLWWNDWRDCEPAFRPVRRRGRPRKNSTAGRVAGPTSGHGRLVESAAPTRRH